MKPIQPHLIHMSLSLLLMPLVKHSLLNKPSHSFKPRNQQFLNILNNTIADAHTHVNKSTAQIHSILQILRQKGMPLEPPAKLALNTDDNFLSDDESDIELPFDDESELTDNESYLDNCDPDLGL